MKQSWKEWLSSNGRGWRILVGLACVVAVALFLHFREVRLEVLELNTTATRYVVAQVDFEFPDYETTIILKQQAMQDVGKVYQIDDRQIREVRHRLENALIRNKDWRSDAPSSTFEEMYKAADELETLLLEARFTDLRTIQIVKELSFPESAYYDFIPEGEGEALLPVEFWREVETQLSARREAALYLMRFFEDRTWALSEDVALEHALRAQVSRTVPEKMTRVQAGSRLVNPGERITSRHITMMQSMKQAISESRHLWDLRTFVSSFLLSFIFIAVSALYFRISQPAFVRSLRQISLFVSIVILTLIFAKCTETILLKGNSIFIEAVRYPVVAPFATILICILLSPRTALFAATFLSIILSVSLAVDHNRFLVLNLVTSIVVIICSRSIRRRKEVFGVCMKTWGSALPVLCAFTLGAKQMSGASLAIDVLASGSFLLATAILVVGLLPVLEALFGAVTDMTLMEFMDPGNELLRRVAIEMPGTYQHSLVLGHLAEAAAQAIGANGLFCRAAALYHDIGKLDKPQFYTENQQGMINIHQLLTPSESAQVIISHIADGLILAYKHHLPDPFLDIIREHHGTTLVYYFYRRQLELNGGKAMLDASFRYPGPKPRSKESAILMICDSIEAASRSLDKAHEEAIASMVHRIVAEKVDDGQFDECSLTFEELLKIKQALVKTLLLANHIRIKYPHKPVAENPVVA